MLEVVSITVGGAPFTLWREMSVHAGVKDASRSMSMTFPDDPQTPIWPSWFKGQPEIKVTARPGDDAGLGGGEDLLFTGRVDSISPNLQSDSFTVQISARAKGADAIDSSVDHSKPDYVNSDVLKVAKDQDAFGIGFTSDVKLDGFDRWRPNVGHTLFASLARLAEDENATLFGQADGSIKITRAGETATPQGAPLLQGQNIHVSISASFDTTAQHSEIQAHGQNYKGNGPSAIALLAKASNSTIERYRPLREHHDLNTTKAKLKKRAERRRDKEQGEGVRAQATVKSFRDDSGMLWTPGKTVFVIAPAMDLRQSLLIESVNYTQTGDPSTGTRGVLSLVDPRAHGGKGGGVNKSGAAWGFDSSASQ